MEGRMLRDSQKQFLKKRKGSVVFPQKTKGWFTVTKDQDQPPFITSCSAQDVITETEDKTSFLNLKLNPHQIWKP